jgi:alkylation response protein AidB-like acyl-CoA dehydrogenase
MDFRIAPDSLELADAVRQYLAGTHGPEVLRRLDAHGNRDPDVWRGLADMGLMGLLVPEAYGGLERSLLDAALIARECGGACLAEPLVDTAFVAVPWMLAKGQTGELAAIAAGDRRVPLVHPINGWVADGDGAALASVDPLRNLTALPGDAADDPLLLDLGALMSAAQLIGLAEAMLDQAVDYAKLREQFGQAIGGFQAIKHKLADIAVALEFARPVLWRAAAAMDDGLASAPLHVSHAKLAATDAAWLAAETAIQVHGAMGYTYEVDLHFWMKRAWALGGAWGSRAFHQSRIDHAIIGGAHPIGARHSFA